MLAQFQNAQFIKIFLCSKMHSKNTGVCSFKQRCVPGLENKSTKQIGTPESKMTCHVKMHKTHVLDFCCTTDGLVFECLKLIHQQ